jgi:hypothetical protein
MAEGFLGGLHRSWLLWSGWLFTVAGTTFGLLVVQAYAWIGALVALAGLCAVTGFAYERYTELRKAEGRHAAETGRLERDLQTAREHAEQAERKLNEVPLTILTRLQATIAAYSSDQLGRLLNRHAEFVGRMQRFLRDAPKRLNFRTFTKQTGSLYAVAKGPPEALAHLRVGDPFLLLHVGTDGLETQAARIAVHQPPESGKDIVMFRIVASLSEEIGHIERLAESRDVAGMKGYRLTPACSVEGYPDVDLGALADFVNLLLEDLLENERG